MQNLPTLQTDAESKIEQQAQVKTEKKPYQTRTYKKINKAQIEIEQQKNIQDSDDECVY